MSRAAKQRTAPAPGVLTLNIGNSSISAAIVIRDRIAQRWSAPTHPAAVRSFRAWLLKIPATPRRAAFACVVPRLRTSFVRVLREFSDPTPLELNCRHLLGLTLAYPQPETLGTDRLAALAGAHARVSPPFILMDAGTALTFNAVTRRGFIGGAIAPGPGMFLDYLAGRTAQLPRLSHDAARLSPVGRGTVESMRIGAHAGFEGMVHGILSHLRRTPALRGAQLVVTGGGAAAVARALVNERVVIIKDLVHLGLAAIESASGSKTTPRTTKNI